MPTKIRNQTISPQAKASKLQALSNRLYQVTNVDDVLAGIKTPDIVEQEKLEGVIPSFTEFDMTKLSSRTLSRYMQYCCGQQSFLINSACKESNKLAAINEAITRTTNALRVGFSSIKKKYLADAEVLSHPEMVKLHGMREIQAARVALLEARCTIWANRVALLSRDQSRRAAEMNKGG